MLEHGSRLKSFKNNGRDLDVNNLKLDISIYLFHFIIMISY